MCGEHLRDAVVGTNPMGSSPHVRGAHLVMFVVRAIDGIIPACAGSTELQTIFKWLDGDHPRMCGEHCMSSSSVSPLTGSSPHVRGARNK